MSIVLRGQVTGVSTGHYYVVQSSKNCGCIYVPYNVCAFELEIGDEVIVKADEWKIQSTSYEHSKYHFKYRATSVTRNNIAEATICEEGSISKIYPNRTVSIEYGNDNIYCPVETLYPGVELNDIVKFKAERWTHTIPHLLKEKLHYKCTSLIFLKKPAIIHASGELYDISSDGQSGIISGLLLSNSYVNITLNVRDVKPPKKSLHEFVKRNIVLHVKAIEQGKNKRNLFIAYRAIVAASQEYEILKNNDIRLVSYDSEEEEEQGTSKPSLKEKQIKKPTRTNCLYDNSFDSYDECPGKAEQSKETSTNGFSHDKSMSSPRSCSPKRCPGKASVMPPRAESLEGNVQKNSSAILDALFESLESIKMEYPPNSEFPVGNLEEELYKYMFISHLREPTCKFCLDKADEF